MKKTLIWQLLSFLLLIIVSSCNTDDAKEYLSDDKINMNNGEALVLHGYNGWDEIRTSADGTTFFNKYSNDSISTLESTMFMLNEDSIGLIYGYVKFDENEMPTCICYNGTSIIVDKYYDDLIDVSVIIGDSILFSVDSLNLGYNPSKIAKTRSVKQNNAIRNLCKVGNVATSAIGVGQGTVMVLAGGAGTILTGGLSSGVSVPTIIAGVLFVAFNAASLNNSLNDLFVEKYNDKEISSTIEGYVLSTGADAFADVFGKGAEEGMKMYLENTPLDILNNKALNVGTLVASLSFSTMDALWGKTITTESALREKYLGCIVLTAKATKITENSARLNGYVNGESAQGYRTRYGFIVSSSDGVVITPPIDNGIGESYFVDCMKLSKATRYKYIAYFWDYTNGYIKFGAPRTFRTKGVPITIENVIKEGSTSIDDNCIIYNLKTELELHDNEDVSDWGFYYLENGEPMLYSMNDVATGEYEYDFKYTSSLAKITLQIGPYVKYKSEEDVVYYGETTSYTFVHNKDYELSIENLNVFLRSYLIGEANFDVEVTIGNKIKDKDGIISYGYYIAERPYYPTTYKKYKYYKTSLVDDELVTKTRSISVKKNRFNNIDENNFIARCNRYSIGTYVRFEDSTYLRLDERDIVLIYDTKPKIVFKNASISYIEELPYDDKTQYNTCYKCVYEATGSFWIDKANLNIWSDKGTWHWEGVDGHSLPTYIFSDGLDTIPINGRYYSTSNKDLYFYIGLDLVDGSRLNSDNSLHFFGDYIIDNAEISDKSFDAYYNGGNNIRPQIQNKHNLHPTLVYGSVN